MELKSYVLCFSSGRGGLDNVEGVKSELGIERYLLDLKGEDDIEDWLEDYEEGEEREYERMCLEEDGFGLVYKIESSRGFEVWGFEQGGESVRMFEGDVKELDDVKSLGELFKYLGIDQEI